MTTPNYVYDVRGWGRTSAAVIWDGSVATVTVPHGTAMRDADSFAGDVDGLSLAIYRAHYLCGMLRPGFAAQSVTLARAIVARGPRAAHAAWLDANTVVKESV